MTHNEIVGGWQRWHDMKWRQRKDSALCCQRLSCLFPFLSFFYFSFLSFFPPFRSPVLLTFPSLFIFSTAFRLFMFGITF